VTNSGDDGTRLGVVTNSGERMFTVSWDEVTVSCSYDERWLRPDARCPIEVIDQFRGGVTVLDGGRRQATVNAAYREWVAEAWPELCSSIRDRALIKGAFIAGWDANERSRYTLPPVNPAKNNLLERIDEARRDVLSMSPKVDP